MRLEWLGDLWRRWFGPDSEGQPRSPARWGPLAAAVVLVWMVSECILVVPEKQVGVLIRKTGRDLTEGQIIALDPGQKGIKADVVLEGWHLLNPYRWTWEVLDQVTIPEGKYGVRIRRHGKDLLPGDILAGEGCRGIVRDVLRPGRYALNLFAEEVEIHDAVTIAPGHVGVVTVLAGPIARDPNTFLVGEGERGIQREVLRPGTYYANCYERQIFPVDLRSQILTATATATGAIQFPSKDGFPITMEGTIEWRIDPKTVSRVFAHYVDRYQSPKDVTDVIVAKVILPNARTFCRLVGVKYLARDFISGETRRKFQDEFQRRMAASCATMGVLVKDALARKTIPPEEIARPIRAREIAIRTREEYQQGMAREREQKKLAMEKRMEERRRLVNRAQADVAVARTRAEQEKDVAIIEATRRLDVARQELKAAQNDAAARLAHARAEADVALLDNAAEARGLADCSRALKGGKAYTRTLLDERLARAIRSVQANTEGAFAELIRRPLAAGTGTAGK